jgi:UDP-N-acetylmuramoylalanine--D-glutamate ligase
MDQAGQASWNWHARRATVLGLAREGTAVVRFLASEGAEVTASDLKSSEALSGPLSELEGLPVSYRLGGHPLDILDADVVFVSPGIPLDAPIVAEARRRGVPLCSESRLFCRLCPAPIVGITGSSGKTTTSTMASQMIRAAGKRVHLGGNIGSPLLDRLAQMRPTDVVVAELSSFQLDFFGPVLDAEPGGELGGMLFPPGGWSPPVAAVLNITANHLDRHPTMGSYVAAKAKIVRYQRPEDHALLNGDDPVARELERQCAGQVAFFSLARPVTKGAYLQGQTLMLVQGGQEQPVCAAAEVRLRGRHNLANVLAACAVSSLMGASPSQMAGVVRTFGGVEHRLEPVRELAGVWYYNDSIATSPERAVAALNSFTEPVVLLAGGRDKHLPWEAWAETVGRKAVQVILFGEAVALIESVLRHLEDAAPPAQRAVSLAEAVELARAAARPGQVVLFSPGGTSFDAFHDYEARGRAFKQLVNALK